MNRMPHVGIDPLDVLEYFRDSQVASTQDYEAWLWLHKRKLEALMREAVEEKLEDILSEVAVDGYPDPNFDLAYRVLYRTVTRVAEQLAERARKSFVGSSFDESEVRELISSLLGGDEVNLVLDWELEFGWFEGDIEDAEHLQIEKTSQLRILGALEELSVEVIGVGIRRRG